MKKLKLSELNLGGAEVLTREELKKVLGGLGGGSGSGDPIPQQIDCRMVYTDSFGESFNSEGLCAGTTIEECEGYTGAACATAGQTAGGSCSYYSCWYEA